MFFTLKKIIQDKVKYLSTHRNGLTLEEIAFHEGKIAALETVLEHISILENKRK